MSGEMKIKKYLVFVFIFAFILLVMILSALILYVKNPSVNKIVTAVDLYYEILMSKSYENMGQLFLDDDPNRLTIDEYKQIKRLFERAPTERVQQFALYNFKDQMILVSTTPDLINGQLYIRKITEVPSYLIDFFKNFD